MIHRLANWLRARKKTALEQRYREGWDWAAGICLRNGPGLDALMESRDYIYKYIELAEHFRDNDEFELGAAAAYKCWAQIDEGNR